MSIVVTDRKFKDEFNEYTPYQFTRPGFVGELSVIKDANGICWFVGMEAAGMLGYARPSSAIRGLVPNKEIKTMTFFSYSENARNKVIPHKVLMISEQGLYALITRSHMPKAAEFKQLLIEVLLDMGQ